jgi:hypothetical protein
MLIFHSYVSLPEGNQEAKLQMLPSCWLRLPAMASNNPAMAPQPRNGHFASASLVEKEAFERSHDIKCMAC